MGEVKEREDSVHSLQLPAAKQIGLLPRCSTKVVLVRVLVVAVGRAGFGSPQGNPTPILSPIFQIAPYHTRPIRPRSHSDLARHPVSLLMMSLYFLRSICAWLHCQKPFEHWVVDGHVSV